MLGPVPPLCTLARMPSKTLVKKSARKASKKTSVARPARGAAKASIKAATTSRSSSTKARKDEPVKSSAPVAGRFWWETTRAIAEFEPFGTVSLRKAAKGSTKRPPKHFAVAINADPKKPIPDACMKSLAFFEAHEAKICKAVLAAIHKHYTMVRKTLLGLIGKDELAATAPPARSVNDMIPLIAFSTLHVHPADAAGTDLGFHFECVWEEEHGLGVRVRNGRVVLVAGEEDASSAWSHAEYSIKEMGNGLGG